MTEQPKKRPLFQYHLSTAAVLMFVAAGLLWLNMRMWDNLPGLMARYGWPTPFYSEWATDEPSVVPKYVIFVVGLLVDCLIAFGIMALVVKLCEQCIRRRERRT